MKKNILNKVLLLALLSLVSCSAKKKLVVAHKPDSALVKVDTTVTQTAVIKAEHLTLQQLGAIQSNQLNFETFSAKAKAKMSIDGSNNDVTLNIRIKKGQEIWVSVTALLGLEGARALITPDSIKVINRLESTYLKKPFSYINEFAGNQVSYQALEALIVGNTWPGLVSDSSVVQTSENGLVLSGALQDIIYKLLINKDMRLAGSSMSSRGIAARNLDVDYNGTFQAAGRVLPAQININATSIKSKINIALTYIKADINTNPEFPFQVPARYSVVN